MTSHSLIVSSARSHTCVTTPSVSQWAAPSSTSTRAVACAPAFRSPARHQLPTRGISRSLNPTLCIPSILMARRADVEAVGGYRHVPYSEDSDLCWRLSERGKLVNLPNLFSKYRLHDASASGSLINGRVMAIGTQLGALSYLRRRAGRHDLTFTSELLGDLKAAVTLEKMVTCASKQLDEKEADHLRLGAGATLMEFARYRPYELDVGDCTFIHAALPYAQRLAIEKRKEVAWYVTETAARLLRKGRLAECFRSLRRSTTRSQLLGCCCSTIAAPA